MNGDFREQARAREEDEYVAIINEYTPETLLSREESILIGDILALEKLDTRIRNGRVNRYKSIRDIDKLKQLFSDIYNQAPQLQRIN